LTRQPGRAAIPLLTAALLVQIWSFVAAQPYPIAAYNSLLGGATTAPRLLTVGWGEGLDQVTDFLNAQPGAESITIASNY
jgi:hypothetical protein